MNYDLKNVTREGRSFARAAKSLWPLLREDRGKMFLALFMAVANSGLNLLGPLLTGFAIDQGVKTGNYKIVAGYAIMLALLYAVAFALNYGQISMLGGVSQRMLWRLRNRVFEKLQELPLSFFNQNKAGDLISRVNNDTEKVNTFFSQALGRFVANFFIVVGAAIFVLSINWKLALMAMIPAVGILIFTVAFNPWAKRKNKVSLDAAGALSAEIQESIGTFRVTIAFDRRDYFRERFGESNDKSFKSAVTAGMASGTFTPVYDFASNIAQLLVLGYGIALVVRGEFAIGLLVSFVLYATRFYDPLREVAQLFASFQSAMAGWDRIGEILHLESDLKILPIEKTAVPTDASVVAPIVEFKDVSFGYPDGSQVLAGVNFAFERGKTYALVGPTGGGKTTTASLIARLYDPTSGTVLLDGRDIRSYDPAERTKKIGFILQDAFLFTGTVRDNILYGNERYADISAADLEKLLSERGLAPLLSRFSKGLETTVGAGSALSLGERQLIAFIRAVLREPEILILDEATANIDTVTEQALEEVLKKLPTHTTKVVIAHRLNTIAGADDIFFVNGGAVREAGSMEHAVEMLLHHKRSS
ncbi:MAG TPA: ABC transporter ATP-binding protein [Candidatus Paceibacterota bacterium]|jgi:ABC-type multidrug transport system, ATPase and permease components